MDKYFCVFQLHGQLSPTRISFEAKHPGDAIVKLMAAANIENTIDLEQGEILKCLRGNDGRPMYLPVFVKEKDEVKGRAVFRQEASATPASAPPPPPPESKKEEDVYICPYKVEVL